MIVNPNLIVGHPDFFPKLSEEEIVKIRADSKRKQKLRKQAQISALEQIEKLKNQEKSADIVSERLNRIRAKNRQMESRFVDSIHNSNNNNDNNNNNNNMSDINDSNDSNDIKNNDNSTDDGNTSLLNDISNISNDFNTSNINLDSFSPSIELRQEIENGIKRCKFLHGCLVTDAAESDLRNVLSKTELLKLYGLYKQAFIGNVNIEQPSYYKVESYFKYQAWHSEKGKSQNEALNDWFELYNNIYNKHSKLFLKYFDENECNLEKYNPFPFINKMYENIEYLETQLTSKNNEIALLKQQRKLTNVALSNESEKLENNNISNDNNNDEEETKNVQGYTANNNNTQNDKLKTKQRRIFELVESIRQRMEKQEQCYEKCEKQWLYQLKVLEQANRQLREKIEEMKKKQLKNVKKNKYNNNNDKNRESISMTRDKRKNNALNQFTILTESVPLLRKVQKHPRRGMVIAIIIILFVWYQFKQK